MSPIQVRDQELTDLAELCLGQLAETPEQLADFLAFAGYDPGSFRAAMGSRALALGLVDYFAQNETLLLTLCSNAGVKPESFMRIWHKLNPAG